MPLSESNPSQRIADLALELSGLMLEATDDGRVADIPDAALSQVLAASVRAYAAKCQEEDDAPVLFSGNSGVTVTDVMINCTAMLQAVNSLVFELGLWQSWTSLGKRKAHDAHPGIS